MNYVKKSESSALGDALYKFGSVYVDAIISTVPTVEIQERLTNWVHLASTVNIQNLGKHIVMLQPLVIIVTMK